MSKIYEAMRVRRLKRSGFLPFEQDQLKVMPLSTPYYRRIVRARASEVKRWRKDGKPYADWADMIMKRYRDNEWRSRDKESGMLYADCWKMVRELEHKHRARNPEYESPWERRVIRKRPDAEVRRMIQRTIKAQQQHEGKRKAEEDYENRRW